MNMSPIERLALVSILVVAVFSWLSILGAFHRYVPVRFGNPQAALGVLAFLVAASTALIRARVPTVFASAVVLGWIVAAVANVGNGPAYFLYDLSSLLIIVGGIGFVASVVGRVSIDSYRAVTR